jgi:hypothetical protein
MKRILVAIAISGATLFAHATVPTPEAVDRLLVVGQAEKILDGVKPQLYAMARAGVDKALKGRQPNSDEQKVLDAYIAKITKIIADTVTMERLRPLYVQLYTQYFTAEDIEAISAFYQTPAGQSLITKMPQHMQGLMAAMPSLMSPMAEQIQAAAQQMAGEMDALQPKAQEKKH